MSRREECACDGIAGMICRLPGSLAVTLRAIRPLMASETALCATLRRWNVRRRF